MQKIAMILSLHKMRRIKELGLRRTARVVQQRVRAQLFADRWRSKVLADRATHEWHQLPTTLSFSVFFARFKKRGLPSVNAFYKTSNQEILEHARALLKAQSACPPCDRASYFAEIKIHPHQGNSLRPDIKDCWQRARFQEGFILGRAYELTGDEHYTQLFKRAIDQWLDANPFLLGVNWINPMEVAIRAANWLLAFHYFKDSPHIDEQFGQRFICSLYDHMIYLENNWEIYDSRTNNHYLSNLIGYFYLCHFFGDLEGIAKKRDWCWQEINRELEKQIFTEGTSYEGSTAYHRFVTELFFHAHAVAAHMDLPDREPLRQRLANMIDFIDWCTPEKGKMVTIGDDDSGTLLMCGLPEGVRTEFNLESPGDGLREYKQFGLIIIRQQQWHVTLRQHAYNPLQPSGHFHNDMNSITIAINGVPVIVDPGSFVYTASAQWRNKFRSATMHNGFYFEGKEPAALTEDLFYLDVSSNAYAPYGLRGHREIALTDNQLIIFDCWQQTGQLQPVPASCWNFILSEQIEAESTDRGWLLKYKNQPLVLLETEQLIFDLYDTWGSPSYGVKVPAKGLRAVAPVQPGQVIKTKFIIV